jgi:hypothetical protein
MSIHIECESEKALSDSSGNATRFGLKKTTEKFDISNIIDVASARLGMRHFRPKTIAYMGSYRAEILPFITHIYTKITI